MQQRKTKAEPNIAEAAEKTGQIIRELQSRLSEGRGLEPADEPAADLEQQLQEYFTSWPGEEPMGVEPLSRIRARVLDGVAARILQGWQQDGNANLFESEVTERLIEEVIELLASKSGAGRTARAFGTDLKSTKTQLQSSPFQA